MTPEDQPSFGALLSRFRLAAGLTQLELAERSGLSVRGISDLERGVKTHPRAYTVRHLADALMLDPDQRAVFETSALDPAKLLAREPSAAVATLAPSRKPPRARRRSPSVELLLAGVAALLGLAALGAALWRPSGTRTAFSAQLTGVWSIAASSPSTLIAPAAVAVGTGGVVYAADSRADRIDAFSRSGRFLFSWGRSGSEPGELRQPLGLALDGQGHVYVADTGNDRVEEFSAHGRFLRTFGRTGRHSGDLSRPEGVSVGVDTGWIYVADTGNHRVQAFTPAGPPVRGWDAKYSQRGKLLRPTSLAVTNEGLVFVTDRPDEQVHVLDADGSFLRDVVSVPAPDFVSPSAVAQDTHDYQYVLDTGLASVRKLDPYGHVLATWHVPSHSARGLAVDGQGNVYVADTGRGQILAFAPGGTLRRSWTGGAKGAAPAVSAAAIAQDPDGKLYVADSRGNQVAVLALTGQLVRRLHGDAAFGPLRRPSGVAAAPDGRIYVADTGNNRIVRFSRGGSIEAAWNQRGSYAGPLNAPHGLGVDSHGYVLVADTLNGRVEELHPSGSVRRIWYVRISPPGRSSRAFPLTDPVCTSAYPCGRWTGLAVGPHGFIYATDTLHDLVVRLSPDGETLQQWGGPGSGPSQFRDPEGVAVSSIGTIYVADTGNHRVDVLSPGGKEIGVIQRGLRSPDYVLVSERRGAAGRLFVADAANGEVRVYAIRQ